MKTNLVSIVMPTYNSVKSTLEAIESVRNQTHDNWEIWVIDDGSNATNQNRLGKKVQEIGDPRINLLTQAKNKGAAAARTLAIENARGRYLAFLDCDDLWEKEKLEKHLKFIDKNGAALSFTSYVNVNQSSGSSQIRTPSKTVTYSELLKSNIIGNSTVILDRNKIELPEIPNLKRRQDFAFWLKILKMGHIGYGLQEPLTRRRISKNSLSSNKLKAARDTWKMYRVAEDMNVFKAAYFFWFYASRSLRSQSLKVF